MWTALKRWCGTTVAVVVCLAVAPAGAQPRPDASSPRPDAPAPDAPVLDVPAPDVPAPRPDVPAPAPSEVESGDAEPAADDPRTLARTRFMRGIQLFESGELDAALAEFRASTELFATRVATRNVAVCLRQLGRYDEALEVLETIPSTFPDMPQEWQRMVARDLEEVAERVGTVRLTVSKPGATVIVSGRVRGKTPLDAIRVTSGSHPIRVVKEGFEPFEGRVEVAGGQTQPLEVELEPLARSGALKVVEVDGREATVLVDQVRVGTAPWSGRLTPGAHMVTLEGPGNLATQPAAVDVSDGGSATLSLGLEPLTAVLRIEPIPAGAQVALDGVLLGRGTWEGRVRPGEHRVEVAAEGFLPVALRPRVADHGIEKVVAELERDPTSPAWQKKHPPRVVLSLALGPAVGPSIGGNLDDCDDCSAAPVLGGRASLRGGYQLGLGIGLYADLGYLVLVQSVRDRAATLYGVAESERDQGTIDDRIFMQGVTVGGALGYAVPNLAPWSIRARVGAGMIIGEASVTRRGDFASASGEPYTVGDFVEKDSALFAYVAPEARFGYRLVERVELNLGLSALIGIAVDVPSWRDQRPVPSATPFFGRFNAPGEEPSMVGTFVVFSPDLGLLVDF